MAVRIWDGGPDAGGASANANWTTPSNWLGDVAPLPDDNLVFPAGALLTNNVNDFTSGTRFRSISISGNYNINGQSLVLLEGVTANHSSGLASFLAPISLLANQTFISANPGASLNLGPIDTATLQLLTVDGSGNINITGSISGSGGITKTGDGTLFISGATDNTYSGITTISQGVVVAQKDTALGSVVAGTNVTSGAALHLQGNITVPEPIVLNGNGLGIGFDGLGALRGVGGNSIVTGDVSLFTNSFIGVDAGASLNLNGAVRSIPGASNNGFTKYGTGTLELSGNRENQIAGTVTVIQGTLLLNKTASGHAIDGPLIIGDNLQGDNASVVRLAQHNQLQGQDFFGTNVNAVTINSSGWLDLDGFDTQVGPVTMVNGPTYSADITTGTGTVVLTGNVTVNNFQGSSALSPPSLISGNLDLGPLLSINSGSSTVRGFVVNQTAVPGATTDLLVSANITGAADVALVKAGAGIMRLSGDNTYHGPTLAQAGFIAVASDTTFGDGLLSLAGGSLIVSDGPRAISNRVSLDGGLNIVGNSSLTFTGPAVLTADRTINIYDPNQVITFAGGIGEGIYGSRSLNKGGKGVLEFTAPNTYSGTTTINTDGGVIRLSGNGTLENNQTVTIGIGGTLALDNTGTNNPDRLHDLAAVNINGGVLSFTGRTGSASGERFGVLSWGDQLSSKIESNVSTAPGSSVHLVAATMPTVGGNRMISFVGNGVGFSATGPNRFTIAMPTAPALTNNVMPLVTMLGPNGYDLVTLESTAEGLDVVPLPANAYVTDITKAEPTSNVKLAGNQTYILTDTRTINGLILGPGATLAGGGSSLTVGTGNVILEDQSNLNINILALPASATITTPRGATAAINSTIFGAGSMLSIGGGGKLILTGENQMSAQTVLQEGVLNLQNSFALGSPAGTTTIRQGAVIELEQSGFGPVNVPNETLNISGTGNLNGGVLRNVLGANSWAGNIAISGDATDQLSLLGLPAFTATTIVNIAEFTRLTLNGAVSGGSELIKTGEGILEYGGVFANTNSGATRILDGTLILNKSPGVNAIATTVVIGDDLGGAADDVLMLAAPDQIPDTTAVVVNSSGNFNLNSISEVTGAPTLFIGPTSSASVFVGTGTWTTNGGITVQSLGGNNPSGALIFGGTLALSVLGTTTAFTRTWLVNDGAAGVDLFVNSTITDGSFQANGAITKTGFGALQYDGAQANTYTGTTTVTDGVLILNKPASVQAFAGNLTIGDGTLTSGGANSDVVKLLAPNQIPDFQTSVSILATGLLDMTDMDETLGTPQGAAITTRLTLTGGNVITGTGVLTINGNIATVAANAPATISGNLNMGTSAMTINVADNGPVFLDLIISADMVGTNANELYKLGTGNLLLTGTNSYTGRTYHTAGVISLGSNSALGSGPLFLQSASLVSYGAPRTLSNAVTLSTGITLIGANPLTFTGLVNMTAATTFSIPNSTFLTFSGGVGELFGSQNLVKAGAGFLRISSLASYSGSTTVNTSGGAILLSGNGALPNTNAVTIGAGGTLALDNRMGNVNNRLRDVSPIALNGGMIDFVGHSGGTNEIVGNITTAANQFSAIRSTSRGALARLTSNALVRNANSMIDFQGFGSDLGSATNQLHFFTFPVLTAGLLPFTTLTKPGDLDFVTYGLTGVAAAPFVTDINNATGKDNVKLTASANITSPKSVNSLLIRGSGIVLSGTSSLTVVSSTIFGAGGQNAITVPTIDFGVTAATIDVDFGSQLAISSSIAGSGGITKIDDGKLIFSGANTYGGTTTVAQGILNIQNSLALGAAGLNTPTNGTTVFAGAALEIEATAGAINVPEELLTINGVGYGAFHMSVNASTSGNAGAMRSISGNNTWAGGVVVSTTGTNTTAFGVDSGKLTVNGVVSGGTGVNVGKFGPGTLQLGGTASNTWTPGTTTIFEGTLELNKTPGLVAVPTGIVVGDSVGGNATLRLLANGQILPGAAITVGAEGMLDLNNFSARAGNMALVSGYSSAAIVASGLGTLTIGNLSVAPLGTTFGSTVPVTVSGNVDLSPSGGGAVNHTITVAESLADDDLIISANISDGDDNANRQGLTKAGAGRAVLSGANTYSGVTNVSVGVLSARSNLALGESGPNANSVVAAGAALEVQDDVNIVGELLTLNSNGVGVTGSLRSRGGFNVWSGNVTLATSSVIGVDAGSHLNLSGVLNIAAGNFTMFKLLPGTLELSGAESNVFGSVTSTVAMREGTLLLNKDAGADAIPVNGLLLVGNEFGGANADVVRLLQGNQINEAATVQVATSGLLDLNGQNETVGPLTMSFDTGYSGSIVTGSGVLTLAGTVTVSQLGGSAPTLDTPAARIDGNVDLGTSPVTINVGVNALMPRELEIHATVSNPNGGSFNKTGSGALALTGDNTGLGGVNSVAAGNLVVGHDNALGNSTLNITGGAVNLRSLTGGGPITLSNPITLNGNLSITGDENLTLTGQVTQVGGARTLSFVMNPDATADLAGGIDLGTAANLVINSSTFGGIVSISGPIVDGVGAGGLTKGGNGELILSGSNSYTGTTTVSGGILDIRSNDALGSSDGGTVVNAGASLELNGNLTIGETLTLNAGTVGFLVPTGAVRSVTGTSVWNGNIVLGNANGNNDAIGVEQGSQLTLTGQITQSIANVGLIKVGGGVLEFAGGVTPNLYVGTTTVREGTLRLNMSPGTQAFGGGLVIGDDFGGQNGDVVELYAAEQILNGQGVTMQSTGRLVGTASQASSVSNETQTVTLTGNTTGGNFQLSLAGNVTGPIPFNATADDVDAALELLPNIGPGNVTVIRNGTGPAFLYTIVFTGGLAGTNQSTLVAVDNLQPAGSLNETQTIQLGNGPTGGNFTLSLNGNTTVPIPFNGNITVVDSALEALPNIGPGNITVTRTGTAPDFLYTIVFTNGRGFTNQNQLVAVNNLTPGNATIIAATIQDGVPSPTPNAGVTAALVQEGGIVGQESIAALAMTKGLSNAASIDTGPGALAIVGGSGGGFSLANFALTTNSSPAATIDGVLNIAGVGQTSITRTFTINDSVLPGPAPDLIVNALIQDGDGTVAIHNLTKSGAGTMVMTAANLYSGTTTVNAAYNNLNGITGALILQGNGGIIADATNTISVTAGATLVLDNTDMPADRIHNLAAVILSGGALQILGNATSGVSENFGTLTINPGVGFESVIHSITRGGALTELVGTTVLRGNGGVLRLVGERSDGPGGHLGDIDNQIRFTVGAVLTNNVMTFATVQGPGGTYDLVRDTDPGTDVNLGRVLAYDSINTPGGNVKLTASDALTADNSINALLIDGNNIALTGTFNLAIGNGAVNGLIANRGGNNTISVPLIDFDTREVLLPIESGSLEILSTMNSVSPHVRKDRQGNLILSGNNNGGPGFGLEGNITINQGTLTVRNSEALGTVGNGTFINSFATLVFDASLAGGSMLVSNEEALTLNTNFGINNGLTGVVKAINGFTIYGISAAPINAVGGVITYDVDLGSELILNATIGGGGNPLTKVGDGVLELGGGSSNTFTGTVSVNQGELRVNKSNGIAISGTIIVGDRSGGNDRLTYGSAGSTDMLVGNAITINQGATFNNDIVDDVLGNITMFGGTLTSTIGALGLVGSITYSAGGPATISANFNLGNVSRNLNVADGGDINDVTFTGDLQSGTFVKTGGGTILMSGNNSSGNWGLNGGVMSIANNNGLGTGTLVFFSNSTLRADLTPITLANPIVFANSIATQATLTLGGRRDVGFTNAIRLTGPMTMPTPAGATALNISVDEPLVNAEISGVMSGGNDSLVLQKIGIGKLRISGDNTFNVRPSLAPAPPATGTLNGFSINAGTLTLAHSNALGASATNINVRGDLFAALEIDGSQGPVNLPDDKTIILFSGNGVPATGVLNNYTGLLRNSAGNNSINGVVDLRGIASGVQTVNVYVNVENNGSLAINNRIIGSNNVAGNAPIENTNRGIIKIGDGELIYGGNSANTISGTTQIWSGTLTLNKTPGVDAVRGTLLVGDNIGASASDVVRLANDDQLAATTTLTVNGSGEYNMNNFDDTVGNVNLIVSQIGTPTISMSGSNLELNGNVTVSAYGGIDGGTNTITLNGNLTLTSTGNATRIFTIANTPTDVDLIVSSRIVDGNGGIGGITKAGPGRMRITGNNSYTAGVSVTGGCLTVTTATAMGDVNTGNVSVGAGAVLELGPNLNIGTKNLTLNGIGFVDSGTTANVVTAIGSGALVTLGGNSSWGGNVVLASAATGINVTSGQFRIDGAISQSGTAGVIKLGGGTLEFNGSTSNTYAGSTVINGGTLLLNKSGGNITAISTGAITIGDNFGGDNADQLNYGTGNSTNQINGANIVILPSGQFNLNDAADTIGSLTASFGPTTGDVNIGLGNLSLGGNLIAIVAAGVNGAAPGLSLTGTLDLDGAARTFVINDTPIPVELDISASLTGVAAANLTLIGVGPTVLEMSGNAPNVYLGTTTLNEGTLILNKSVGPAIPGAFNIGDSLGGAVDLVRYGAAADNNQIADNSVVTIASSGILDLATNNKSDAIGNATTGLVLNIGNVFSSLVQSGTGVLTVLGNINVATAAATTATSPSVVISGNLDLQLLGGGPITRTITVADSLNPIDVVISATIGDGDATPQSFTKAGAGTLLLSGNNTFTGSLSSTTGVLILEGTNAAAGFTNVAAGDLILRSQGTLANSPAYALGVGARLFIDNSTVNLANRLSDFGPVTLAGNNTVLFTGRPGQTSTESIGSIILAANSNSLIESDVSTTAGSRAILTATDLVRLPGAKVTFVGGGAALGTTANQIRFVSPPALTPATTGILPYATLLNPSGPELVTYGANGITAPSYATSLATAGPNDIVKLTESEIFDGVQTIGALILVGDGINLTGVGQLRIASGSITVLGAHSLGNTISIAELALGAVTESLINIDTSSTLTLSGAISSDTTNTIRKQGTGTLVLAGDNTVTGGGLNGNVSIEQGILRVTHGRSLGNTFPLTGTSVLGTAALQIEGSIAIGNETLSLAGSGFNNDGGGALQLLSGNASWGTGNTPINLAASTVSVAVGSRLTLNATLNGSVVMTKVGLGTLTLSGNATNAQSTTVNEGTVELAKNVPVVATSTLIIGDNLGGDNADRVVITTPFNGQFLTTAGITVNSTGLLDLNGANITVNGLTLVIGDDSSGDVTTGAGTLTMSTGGNIAVSQVAAPLMTSNGSVPATISGNLAMPSTRTITLSDSPAANDLIITANLSGNAGIIAAGAGRVVFDPAIANTFTGGINLGNNTILTVRNSAGNNSALGADTAGVTVNSSAALELDNFTMNGAENIVLLGPGAGGRGALRNVSGANAWGNGTITLNASAAIGVDAGSTLTVPGVINAAGNLTFTKVGAGTLDLTANNAGLTVPTVVNEGKLRFSGANGASASPSYTINTGATVELNNLATNNPDRLVGNPSVTLNGGNFTFIGNTTVASIESIGPVTLASGASRIQSVAGVAGQRLISDSLTRNPGATVQFEGLGADLGTNGHTIEFVTAPTHTGGILPYATIVGPAGFDFARQTGVSIERLPAGDYHTDLATATPTDNVKVTTSQAGFGNITVNSLLVVGNGITVGQTGDSLSIGDGFLGAIGVAGGNNTLSGNLPVHFGTAEGIIRTGANAGAILASPIDGSNAATGLTISGDGVVWLRGLNNYTGVTNILAGGVVLENSNGLGVTGPGNGTVVASGASLALDTVEVGDEALALNGNGFGSFGALINVAGDNTWGTGATAISVPTASAINVFFGSLTLNGTISGAGTLTKTGAGTLVLAGTAANTFTGGLSIEAGAVHLRKTTAVSAIASGTVTIGDGSGTDSLVFTGTDTQIAAAVNVIVNSSGVLDLNNRSTTVNNLVLTGSTVNTGTGVLTIGAAVITQPSSNTAVINGFLGMTAARNFAIYDNPQADDLLINASITGAGGAPTKIGRGTMVFNNVNTYTGTTTAQLGVLEIRNAGGLGTTAAGTIVNNGATLRMTAVGGATLNVGNETISFPGTGLDGVGSWEVNGNVTWAGAVTLATTPNVTIAGNGSLALQDVAGVNFGFNKSGDGTLELAGNSTNTGATNVVGGTLLVTGRTSPLNTITLRNGGTLAGTGIVGGTVLVGSGGMVSPGRNGVGTLTTGTIRFTSNSTLFVDITGMNPGVDHDVLNVVGGIFLNGALLAGTVPIIPTIGDQFHVIENDFADAVVGDFAAVDVVTIDFRNFSINKAGGDGNDIVFTSVFTPSNQAPVINAPSSLIVVLDNAVGVSPFSITDTDAGNATNMRLTLTVSHGTLTLSTSVFGGLTVSDITGNGTNSVTIISSLAKMNATFGTGNGLVYRRDSGFLGSDTIVVVADDQGNSGIGGAQQSTRNILLSVVGVSAWQNNNPGRSQLDVNNDGNVNGFDVITMVSELNARGGVPLPGVATPPPYIDVNGDGNLSAIDLLLVVAFINGSSSFAPLSTVVVSPDAIAADPETVEVLAASLADESPTIQYFDFDDPGDDVADANSDEVDHVAFALAAANASQQQTDAAVLPAVAATSTSVQGSRASAASDAWDYSDTLASDIIDGLFAADDDEVPAVLLTELE